MNSVKIGIIMGHGHAYPQPKLPFWLPDNIKWSMVDINPLTKPDIIGDYNYPESLGYNKWDYVIEWHCPIHDSLTKIRTFMANMKDILKPRGQLIVYVIPMLLRTYYPEKIVKNDRNVTLNSSNLIQEFQQRKLTLVDQELIKLIDDLGFTECRVKNQYSIFTK